MKKYAKYMWNIILIVSFAVVSTVLIPQIINQWSAVNYFPIGTLRDRVLMTVFVGIGLYASIALFIFTMSTAFIDKLSFFMRLSATIIFAVFTIGTIVAIYIDYRDMGRASYPGYVRYMAFNIIFLFPIIIFGRGYPNLAKVLCLKLNNRNNAEQPDSADGGASAHSRR